jgi:hypothetical protein
MCHRATEDRAWQCACGYEFGQDVAKTRELLRDQLTNAKIMLAIFIVLDAASVALLVAGLVYALPVIGFIFFIGGTVRAVRKIAISRESLRLLAPKELPAARVVER